MSPLMSTTSPPLTTTTTPRATLLTTPRAALNLPLRFSFPKIPSSQPHPLKIQSVNAAQPYESEISNELSQSCKLKIVIVGFGNFGQFLANTFIRQGHTVLAHSRTDYTSVAKTMGATFFQDPHDFCVHHPDIVLLCTSIISTKQVLLSLPMHRLRRNTLFVDVLSVKEEPRNLFLQYLPEHFDILCTHPMFGPESGKESWKGLPFVYDKVRIGDGDGGNRVEAFLEIFEKEGCRMVEMSCSEHDNYAISQFITHTVGRVLKKMELKPTRINTKGDQMVLELVEMTSRDSDDLYYGLFRYNDNAREALQRLRKALEEVVESLDNYLN